MLGRKYNAGTNYRYGFNGKENDNEVKGESNQQDYGMRISDPRLGRFLSVDPITAKYPELTPYQFASNRPIDGIDLDGKEWSLTSTSTFNGKTLIQKTNEYVIKILVINSSTKKDVELKAHLETLKWGAEKILQNTFVTLDKKLEVKNSVKIEFVFSEKSDPTNTSKTSSNPFSLEVFDALPKTYASQFRDGVTLGHTDIIGNTQKNGIQLAIGDEIPVSNGMSKFTFSNTPNTQAKALAEEILHTGSLGHVGLKEFGDRPDETSADIQTFTSVLDPVTNVMIQQGQQGIGSTTNVYQFEKIEQQTRKDLGNKVKDVKINQ